MSRTPFHIKIKTCKRKCNKIEGYVGLKQIKFGAEMGYKKCIVCECHFLLLLPQQQQIYCQCCNNKLRVKNPRRTVEVKQRAKKFQMEILNKNE